MKVFLSLPMSGRSDDDIERQIAEMQGHILDQKVFDDENIEFVENFTHGMSLQKLVEDIKDDIVNEPLVYLGGAIALLSRCDVIVMGEGWMNARGCAIEYDIARRYNIPIYITNSEHQILPLNEYIHID